MIPNRKSQIANRKSHRIGSWFLISTGRRFWPFDPRPEDISIEDIAHALSHICRFGGHCRHHYSVAQHSVLVSELAPPQYAFAALMHDAPEAYCNDIVHPMKIGLPDYCRMESHIYYAVSEAFNLPMTDEALTAIKRADRIALSTERRDLLPFTTFEVLPEEAKYPPDPRTIERQAPETARASFMARFDLLFPK